MHRQASPSMRFRTLLVLVVAWGALVLAVGQLACGEEHHAGDSLESAACLILAVVAVARAGLPKVERRFRASRSMRSAVSTARTVAILLTPDAARGSPIPASSPLRC